MAFDPRTLIPLAVTGLNPGGGGGFARGWARAQQEAEARRLQDEQRAAQQEQVGFQRTVQQEQLGFQRDANTRANASSTRETQQQQLNAVNSFRQLLEDPNIDDPTLFDQRLQFATQYAPTLGVDPGFLQSLRPAPTVFQQREARAKLKEIAGAYSAQQMTMLEADDQTGSAPLFTLKSGEKLTIAQLRERAGTQPVMPDGRPASLRTQIKPDVPNTPEEQFYQQFASERGKKSFAELSTADQSAARKQWMQSDDRQQPQATILIQTVDENGNPVQRLVPRTSGTTFAASPSPGQQTAMAEQETGLALIADIDRSFKPEYVGPVTGRAVRMQMAVPGTPDVKPEVAEFHAAVASLRNEIIRLMSGAAVSGAEEARMRSQLPDVTDKPSVFQAKLNQTRRNRETLLAKMQAHTGSTPTPTPRGAVPNPFRP